VPSEPIKTLETVMREWREIHFDEDACGYDHGTAQQAQDCADALQPVRDALWGRVDQWNREADGYGNYSMKETKRSCARELAAILGEREG